MSHCYACAGGEVLIGMITMWEVWRNRNILIFRGICPRVDMVVARICASVPFSETQTCHVSVYKLFSLDTHSSFPYGFFYGATETGVCGAGMVIFLSPDHYFHLNMRARSGSNTRAELVALWGLLYFTMDMGIVLTHIFGDSQCIIDWAHGNSILRPILLKYWL